MHTTNLLALKRGKSAISDTMEDVMIDTVKNNVDEPGGHYPWSSCMPACTASVPWMCSSYFSQHLSLLFCGSIPSSP
jgi:hypothetical protein